MSAATAQVPLPTSLHNHDLEISALHAVRATNIAWLANSSPLITDQFGTPEISFRTRNYEDFFIGVSVLALLR
jgi:hypothetical protein